MSFHDRTTHAAKGKWRGILLELGLPEKCLVDRHNDCPLCDGERKFRWDNKEGKGTYICVCGAGDGMDLAMRYTGLAFKDIAARIDDMIGNIKHDPEGAQRREMPEEDRRAMLRDMWKASQPMKEGDLADRYLESRGVAEKIYPPALRFAPKLKDGEGGIRPCMLAMVGVPGEPTYCAIHRTFLRPDGKGKAEMESPRKLTRGELPQGACIQLGEYVPGGPLGVAEGIETALAASALFSMPVWATLNTALMKAWRPPEGCEEVVIFGDNDPKFGGQAAAYQLAFSIVTMPKRSVTATVKLPDEVGMDWNDVWMREMTGQ